MFLPPPSFKRMTDKFAAMPLPKDFVIRRYGLPRPWVFIVISVVIVISLAVGAIYLPWSWFWLLASFLLFVALVISFAALIRSARIREVITAVELQNALLSQAIRVRTACVMLIDDQGGFLYGDPMFHMLFNDQHIRKCFDLSINLSHLVASGCISIQDREALLQKLKEAKPVAVPFDLFAVRDRDVLQQLFESFPYYDWMHERWNEWDEHSFILQCDPIVRPQGYACLRVVLSEKARLVGQIETMFDHSHVPAYGLDMYGAMIYANNAFIELVGYRHSDINSFQRLGSFCLAYGKLSDEGALVLRHRSGDRIEACCYPLGPASHLPNVRHFIVMPQNQRFIAPLEDHWSLFENMRLPVMLLDNTGVVRKTNQTLRQLFKGYLPAEKIGWLLQEMFPVTEHVRLEDFCRQKMQISAPINNHMQGSYAEDGLEILLPHGGRRCAFIQIFPLQWGAGEQSATQYLLMMRENTKQKLLVQHALQDQKMQAIGQLSGSIAHDFNNLLTAMLGYCDLLLSRHAQDDISFPDIMQIRHNALRAAGLVQQLLAFSRQQEFRLVPIDMGKVLENSRLLLGRLVGENIDLLIDHHASSSIINANSQYLEQIIVNLAVNSRDAILATGNKRGSIKISSSNEFYTRTAIPVDYYVPEGEVGLREGGYVVLSCRDSGSGISQDDLNRIFEPFYTTKSIGQGTGLGLATVLGIVKQFNGYIYVKTAIGEGTEFRLYFPIMPNQDTVTEVPIALETQEQEFDGHYAGATILLVEDEDAVRRFTADVLSRRGYHVLQASCSDEALEQVKDFCGTIDMVISDVMLPGMDGPTLMQEIYKAYQQPACIFISGYSKESFCDLIKDNMAYSFIQKPFTISQLLHAVTTELAFHRGDKKRRI
jgi:signal transduction histidine kinase/CheY-like chemotaxis protein/PAS domain-containing protein